MIELNEEQQALAVAGGTFELLLDNFNRMTNNNIGGGDALKKAIDGKGAELAHWLMTKELPGQTATRNLSVYDGRGGLNYDTVWRGWHIDVKSRTYVGDDGYSMVPVWQLDAAVAALEQSPRHCDCYAFFQGTLPTFTFLGYVSLQKMAKLPIKNFGQDGHAALVSDMLRDPDALPLHERLVTP